MGSYFSLRGQGEWDHTVSETMEPSIWTNVNFTPLARTQHVMLPRRSEIQFVYPGGLRIGGDVIQVSDTSDLSLLVGFEETSGRFYSGLLVHASLASNRHTYSRAVEEVVLTSPSVRTCSVSSPASKAQAASGSEPFSGSISLGQLDAEEAPARITEWEFLLFYAVKEGVLVFFGHDLESCEEVVRDIAASYGEQEATPESLSPAGSRRLSDSSRVKCVSFKIGRAPPPVGRVCTEMIDAELKRQFAIRCDASVQSECTNCVVFCLRMMLAMKLSVRGFDIRTVCDSRPDLGALVGTAAGDAWEQLWRVVRT